MRIKVNFQLFHIGHDYFVVDMSSDDIDHSYLYEMNEATAFLWKEFHDKDFTPDQMAIRLCEVYDVDANTAQHDIHQMLESWKEYGILT